MGERTPLLRRVQALRIRGGWRVLAVVVYMGVEYAVSWLSPLLPGGHAGWDLLAPVYDVAAVYLLTRLFRARGEGDDRRPRWRMTGYAPASFVLALVQLANAAAEVQRLVSATSWSATLAHGPVVPVWVARANTVEGLASSLLLAALYAGSWWRLWRSVTSGPTGREPAVWLPGGLPRRALSRAARVDLGPLVAEAMSFAARRLRDGDPVLPFAVATDSGGALRFVDPTADDQGARDADALRERCSRTLAADRAALRATCVVTASGVPDGATVLRFDLEHADGSAVTARARLMLRGAMRELSYGELSAHAAPALVRPGGTAPVVDAAV